MLNVQKYLQDLINNGKSNVEAFEQLSAELGIKVKDYPEDGMVLLDYDQIASPKSHPIVIECRSLILHRDSFRVISRKFDRFFNYGECPEFYADFNFNSSVVMEKADGSLIGIYFHNGRWEISTRGMAKAEGQHVLGGTFREKVVDAFGFSGEDEFQKYFAEFPSTNTYVFEYTSHENRIVTKYAKPEMVLLGVNHWFGAVYNLWAMIEIVESMVADGLSVRMPKMYDLTEDMDALAKVANELPDLQEGFVVWDPVSGKRVKLKAATYVIAHKLRGNDAVPTRKNLLILVLEGEVDEFLAYFPEWGNDIEAIKNEVAETLQKANEVWKDASGLADQKAYALVVKDLPFSGLMFEARKKNQLPSEAFLGWDVNRKLRLFGI